MELRDAVREANVITLEGVVVQGGSEDPPLPRLRSGGLQPADRGLRDGYLTPHTAVAAPIRPISTTPATAITIPPGMPKAVPVCNGKIHVRN